MSEDWDEEIDSTSFQRPMTNGGGFGSNLHNGSSNANNNSGFGSSQNVGVGKGRGRGRGLGAFTKKTESKVGSSTSPGGFGSDGGVFGSSGGGSRSSGGGFGSSGGGSRSSGRRFESSGGDSRSSGRGFGSNKGGFNAPQNGGGDDDWDEGVENSGFGSRGGDFGGSGGDGFGRRPSGGNRGGRGGGSNRGYWDKSSGFGGFQSRGFVNRSRGGGRGGGASGSSSEGYKCHETGHFAREGTNEPAEAGGKEGKPPASTYIPPEPSQKEEEIFFSMQKGINFDKYDDIPVEVSGNNRPNNITSFDEAKLYPKVRENVMKARYDKPTPVQKYGIPIISAGRDLMACAQTGSGKTAAFLLPILTGMLSSNTGTGEFSAIQKPQTIIVSPTRELALQIFYEARKFSHGTMLNCVVAYGGTSVGHQLQKIERGCNLLVATPGRLNDFIGREKIGLDGIKYLVLDEADRMLDMGFGPDMERLINHRDMPKKGDRQTLMFSATFPNEVQERAAEYLDDYLFLTVGRVGGASSDVKQAVMEVTQFEKKDKLVELLHDNPESDRTLVFTETKRGADFLASFLSQSSFPTTSIHGDRMQREREEALEDFKKGRACVLVATSVAARGLDIPNVKHVVNFDLPDSIDEYVHRIGRTGRCGNLGKSTSFYDTDKDAAISRALIKVLADAHQEVPDFLESAADAAVGTFHGTSGGRFGGRDTRRGRGGGRGGGGRGGDRRGGGGRGGGGRGGGGGNFGSRGGDDDWGSANDGGGGGRYGAPSEGGFGGSCGTGEDEDESWD